MIVRKHTLLASIELVLNAVTEFGRTQYAVIIVVQNKLVRNAIMIYTVNIRGNEPQKRAQNISTDILGVEEPAVRIAAVPTAQS